MSRRGLSVLVTILFTDIVGSTEIAAELGDRRWRDLVRRHHQLVRRELKRFRGRELDTAGDGFFARFDRPADAIRCACAISDAVRDLGIEVRAGLHVGEAEILENEVGGITVNVGARLMGVGKAGEVLVSSTLRDAVAGSGFGFADHGVHRLKGIEGEWRLYEVMTIDGERRPRTLDAAEARTRRSFAEATPVRRRRDLTIAAAVAAVVVGTVVVAYASGVLRTERRAPRAAPSGPDPALLRVVPQPFRPSCVRSTSAPPGAIAAVDCRIGEFYDVTYARFDSGDDLGRAFESFASPADPTATDCSREPSARGEYTVNGTRAGDVACYVDGSMSDPSAAESVIVWTDEELSVLGRAVRGDSADLTHYEWWRTATGPWATEATPPKDGDPHDTIEGVFGRSNSDQTLTFSTAGRYQESDFAVYGDAGLLYGKPSTVLMFHDPPAPTFGGICPRYEAYRYRLRGDRLVLHLLAGECREYASRDIDGTRWTRVG